MDAKAAVVKDTVSDADINQKLKDAADAAKKAADPNGRAELPSPPPPASPADEVPLGVTGEEEKSVAGRKKMKGGEKWDVATGKEAAMVEKQGETAKEETAETKKEHEVELELNDILKRSPSGFAADPRSWPVGR